MNLPKIKANFYVYTLVLISLGKYKIKKKIENRNVNKFHVHRKLKFSEYMMKSTKNLMHNF